MRAIVTDLDRTLLRTDKTLSDYTLEVLQRCHDRGILVLAASARPLRDIRRYDDIIHFDAITATNGAVIRKPKGVKEVCIPRKSGEAVLAGICAFPDIFLSIETDKGLYSNRDIPAWKPVVYDGFPKLPEDVLLYKILVSSEQPQLYEGIGRALTGDVYHTIANRQLIQIMSRDASKWNGIRHMLTAFGVPPADVVYFGDDNDDIEPLQNCGLGVAVANAIPAALEAAGETTDSNDADGVARYIEKYIL